jgi:hypothetical protein
MGRVVIGMALRQTKGGPKVRPVGDVVERRDRRHREAYPLSPMWTQGSRALSASGVECQVVAGLSR